MKLKPLLQYNSDLKIILVACFYFGSAVVGYQLSFQSDHLTTIWPPSGIALSLLLLLGRKTWPGVTIGALLANLLAYWHNPGLEANTLVTLTVLIATGYTLEALFGNYLIKRLIPIKNPFSKTLYAFRFLFIGFTISIIGSVFTVLALSITGILSYDMLLGSWFSLWVGNVAGIFLFTPLTISFREKLTFNIEREKSIEIAAFIFIVIALVAVSSVPEFFNIVIEATPLLVLPLLLWLAFRFNLSFALSCVLVLSIGATYYTVNGFGPFIMGSSFMTMLMLQIFVGVISITTLILATTVRERKLVQLQLESFNEQLESKVELRTQKLNQEINNRKGAETKLKKTNSELRKINSELDNFVYSISHDLRAPIASVLGLINVAKLEKDPNMVYGYLDMINASALRQDSFIRDILNQSRNARLELKSEKIDFNDLIDEVFEQLLSNNKSSKVEKSVNIDQHDVFFSDKWRLKVIMNNLISNSIRYRNGKDPVIGIDVNVTKELARISIRDNGRGISRKHLSDVWKMFYRATDDNAGSGLGLYIVKETIEKLSGKVEIDSRIGKGTTVTFEIPKLSLN